MNDPVESPWNLSDFIYRNHSGFPLNQPYNLAAAAAVYHEMADMRRRSVVQD